MIASTTPSAGWHRNYAHIQLEVGQLGIAPARLCQATGVDADHAVTITPLAGARYGTLIAAATCNEQFHDLCWYTRRAGYSGWPDYPANPVSPEALFKVIWSISTVAIGASKHCRAINSWSLPRRSSLVWMRSLTSALVSESNLLDQLSPALLAGEVPCTARFPLEFKLQG